MGQAGSRPRGGEGPARQVTHMVEEARLVSSCFSFPSRARPLFSRLLLSRGVRVYTLQKVELAATWSLPAREGREGGRPGN